MTEATLYQLTRYRRNNHTMTTPNQDPCEVQLAIAKSEGQDVHGGDLDFRVEWRRQFRGLDHQNQSRILINAHCFESVYLRMSVVAALRRDQEREINYASMSRQSLKAGAWITCTIVLVVIIIYLLLR